MSMQPFAYASATSVQEAVAALGEHCRPLAGGTDLLGLMKAELVAPQQLVNLKTIPGLRGVRLQDDGWHIGALTTLAGLAADEQISGPAALGGLYEAILRSASPQLRHMATLGGNLVQHPRCWYYRNPLTFCWRKGGSKCFAFRGENKYHVILSGGTCFAVHPSDPAVALLALNASVALTGPEGTRTLPLGEFYRRPSREDRSDNVLALNELITEVVIPKPSEGARSAYAKVADRATWDFALVSAGAQVVLADGVVERARLALGGVALWPWHAAEAEQVLVGKPLTEENIQAAAQAATSGVRPLEHNGYKVALAQGVVRQVLRALA